MKTSKFFRTVLFQFFFSLILFFGSKDILFAKEIPDCSICMEKIIDEDDNKEEFEIIFGEHAYQCPNKCAARYHLKCIEGWLKQKPICPNCCCSWRAPLLGAQNGLMQNLQAEELEQIDIDLNRSQIIMEALFNYGTTGIRTWIEMSIEAHNDAVIGISRSFLVLFTENIVNNEINNSINVGLRVGIQHSQRELNLQIQHHVNCNHDENEFVSDDYRLLVQSTMRHKDVLQDIVNTLYDFYTDIAENVIQSLPIIPIPRNVHQINNDVFRQYIGLSYSLLNLINRILAIRERIMQQEYPPPPPPPTRRDKLFDY